MLTIKKVYSREPNKICASKKIIYRRCQGIPYDKGMPIQNNVMSNKPKKYAQLYNNPTYLYNPRFYNIYTYIP